MKTAVPKYHDEHNTLKIESFYHITVSSDSTSWTFPRHSHGNFLEVSLIVDGEGTFEYNHNHFSVTKGDLIIKNAGTLHSECSTSQCFEQYCLGISGVQNPGMPPNTLLSAGISPVIRTGEAFDYLRAATKYLFYLSNDPEVKAPEIVHQTIEHELSVINMLVADKMKRVEQKEYSKLIASVLEYIDTHFSESLTLDSIAKSFFVSSYYLAHKFKRETGYTIKQYILNRKLGEAQSLLVFSDVSIKDIAAICGYSNLQYFYSVFKKSVGITPNELRNSYKNIQARVPSI
jgi:AraC-like DNA-binding protein